MADNLVLPGFDGGYNAVVERATPSSVGSHSLAVNPGRVPEPVGSRSWPYTEKQQRASETKASFAATEKEWKWVAGRLEAARDRNEPVGLDTEFDGVDISTYSPAGGAARVHVWSMAVLTSKVSPRGFPRSIGFTLPESALAYGPIRDLLEDSRLCKAVHNLPVDYHALRSHGITLGGGLNTLSLARWVWPERKNSGEGFGLKDLMALLGREPLGDFGELLSRPNVIYKTKKTKIKTCLCEQPGCKRKGAFHRKFLNEETSVYEFIPKNAPRVPVPLREIVPGHWLWPVLVPYAAEDSEAALELLCYAKLLGSNIYRDVPWLK